MNSTGRRRLLLVEDDLDLTGAIMDALADANFEVVHAANGADALEKLRAGTNPDVIVLDLMMPKMNGWQFRLAQKEDSRFVSTPVIVMSANHSAHALAIDADIHLPKPFPLESLLSAIERAIALHDRRRSATRRALSDRFASVWTLASGIAHEINNPLMGLLGNLELIERLIETSQVRLPDRISDSLLNVRHAAEQIARVVKDTAMLASSDEVATPSDANIAVQSALAMLSTEVARRAQVKWEPGEIPKIRIAPGRLLQVLLNLLMNASQSLSGKPNGAIRVRTFTSEVGSAVIEISDNGCGIPADQLALIFDPFFTTKPPGCGTGLGLSISHEIVSAAGGRITVTSTLGVGSTFRVELPAAEAQGLRAVGKPSTERGPLRILLVEENEVIAETIRHILPNDEFVVEAELQGARKRLLSGEHFDAVVCDLNLPDGSGAELHVALSQYRPELVDRFLLMTGGVRRRADVEFIKQLGARALTKPFEGQILETAIREIATAAVARVVAPDVDGASVLQATSLDEDTPGPVEPESTS